MNVHNYNEIVNLIKILANFVRIDANTFLWAKSQHSFAKEKTENENSIYDMGGGNFYIGLASLSFYGFISKIYEIINSDNCEKLFKKDKHGRVTNVYKNETKAVEKLTKEINADFHLIEESKDADDFWKLMRHGLVHCFLPKGGKSTLMAIGHLDFKGNINYYDYIRNLNQSVECAIRKNNKNGFDLNSDLLAIKVVKISEWLVNDIANRTYVESKNKLIKFLLEG